MTPDQLYELLPAVHRRRDAETGGRLAALLAVIAEQADIVHADIERLYANWFVETCEDWVVPYLGDLVGYRLLPGAAAATGDESPEAYRLLSVALPRREVAATVANRRRKGTLALLEDLAADVADWPARAVEHRRLLALTQPVRRYTADDHDIRRRLRAGRLVDLRSTDLLDRIDGPFDELAHTVEVPRSGAARRPGRYGIPDVTLYVWRLRTHTVTRAPAFCLDRARSCYTFSVLGNDTQLLTRPVPEPTAGHIADETNLPTPIRRRALVERLADYYGPGKSICVWTGPEPADPVPLARIVPADLSGWAYRPHGGKVALDPVLGRIAFPSRHAPEEGVWVSYRYGFPADLGGGEYPRPDTARTRPGTRRYLVGPHGDHTRITDALDQWQEDKHTRRPEHDDGPEHPREGRAPTGTPGGPSDGPSDGPADSASERPSGGSAHPQAHPSPHSHPRSRRRAARPSDAASGAGAPVVPVPAPGPVDAVVEITSSEAYQDLVDIRLDLGERLTVRAADGARPVLRLLDWSGNRPDALRITGTGRGTGPLPVVVLDGLTVTGRSVQIRGPIGRVVLRHCTLVPGWDLDERCRPQQPEEASLELIDTPADVLVEHSVLGTVVAGREDAPAEPNRIHLTDSVLDATGRDLAALTGVEDRQAPVVFSASRSTVIGTLHTRAVGLLENCLLDGDVRIGDVSSGCVRFSWLPPGSRTPRRFHCEPDHSGDRARVAPRFTSTRYGTPGYVRLADDCPDEIRRGAEDGSEMGALHDLFLPLREEGLRARLAEYTPAGCDSGIHFVT
ncbi:hypothetical protein OH807_36590 [Kitasatospora sp. NBC_01560]|uniref:hypothetical protein n=1 Tax=Kitasatospora sp. NBC_01560 TaxID=2975965 RepID=UPI003868A7F6